MSRKEEQSNILNFLKRSPFAVYCGNCGKKNLCIVKTGINTICKECNKTIIKWDIDGDFEVYGKIPE